MAMTVNNVISNYTYTYNNQMRAKLDKDDNAVWDKSELKNYADAYSSATGKTLDVDKLMEKYANEDGVIDYAAQEQMRKDDALGFSALQAAASAAASSSTSSTSTSGSSTSSTATTGSSGTMSQQQKLAALDAVRAFSYEYSGKLQPLLDKNKDGMWGKDELTNYANAYKKATGGTIDVDSLMKKYGNEDGFIDPTKQAAVIKDDALGLTNLKSAYDKALATKDVTYNDAKLSSSSSKSQDNFSLQDLLGTMSSNGKAHFSMMINKYESQGSMLSAFGLGSSSSSGLDVMGLLSGANTLQMYKSASMYGNSSAATSAMSGQMMNFTL